MSYSVFPTPAPNIPPAKRQKTDLIKATQVWTAPSDVSDIEVILCGGGGGGGASAGSSTGGTGGNGSVTYDIVSVTPGQSYTVTIGAGGAGAPAGSFSTGSTGGTSSLGALISITGGQGGICAQAGGSPQTQVPPGLGGFGGTAAFNANPQDNQGGLGFMGYGTGGQGNSSAMNAPMHGAGMGAVGGIPDDSIKNAKANTGAGGGGHGTGAATNYAGGNGGSGIAVIKYWTAE